MSLEDKNFILPLSFKKVELGKTTKDKRKIVEEHDGQIALIKDFHHRDNYSNRYIAGELKFDKNDFQCYGLFISRSVKRLHYDDLEELIVACSPKTVFDEMKQRVLKEKLDKKYLELIDKAKKEVPPYSGRNHFIGG